MGTGIGGAVLVDGRVLRGRNGMAGEFGHMQVVPDGQPCECGGRGCWEQYASGNALVRYARAQIGLEPSVLAEACDGDPDRLTGPMVTEAAADGDLVARQAFGSVGDWLGVGLANLVAALDPRPHRGRGRGVGGGGPVARARPPRAGAIAGRGRAPGRTAGAGGPLGPEAGVVGAAELARRSL